MSRDSLDVALQLVVTVLNIARSTFQQLPEISRLCIVYLQLGRAIREGVLGNTRRRAQFA